MVTPLLPTTPFLLLAAFFFSRSSPRFHLWLYEHHLFGPLLKEWETNGAIPLSAKIIAVVFLSGSGIYMATLDRPPLVAKVIAIVFLLAVGLFILTRPSVRR